MCSKILFLGLFLSLNLCSSFGFYLPNESPMIRGRSLRQTDPIPCNKGTSGNNCVCPGKCLTYYNSTGNCHPNNCWTWDNMNDECLKDGKSFVAPLVLQSIPVTGVFGAGWGNMGRWDVFARYMAVFFGGVGVFCIGLCCLVSGPEENAALAWFWQCLGYIWTLALVVLWIWGIVEIANKPDAPWTDWQGNTITCPLID